MKEKKMLSLGYLNKKEMKKANAGCITLKGCGCACAYSECGGSSTYDNWDANQRGGLTSIHCPD